MPPGPAICRLVMQQHRMAVSQGLPRGLQPYLPPARVASRAALGARSMAITSIRIVKLVVVRI